ncbi:MAG TPA: hypothetical protein VMG82_19430 [Candidatus Sulfotelmatobacter sp.]|nr:hypothetical protein [Candidatus Sulfotelmatobacter sp.]
MTRAHKIEAWIAAVVIPLVAIAAFAIIRWQKQKPITLHGAIIVQDTDPRRQLPIGGVEVSAGKVTASTSKSDSSGYFSLTLPKPARRGQPIVLHFRHPQYRPLDQNDYVGNQLYIVHLVPLDDKPAPNEQPKVKLSNLRIRYTVKTQTELNVGSAVRTFEVQNRGNVPCKNQHPCSPDGKWKAALGSSTLDAGVGNQFRAPRASCIAGPCPFTHIESNRLSKGDQILTLTVRNWSDTATFLLEAEVFRPMMTQVEHWSYPAIFGDGFSFTMPSSAESVSMEADVDGQTIVFPLGPSLQLSWASCDAAGINPDEGTIYRCSLRPGYHFR